MEDEVVQLQQQVSELQKLVTDLRLQAATRDGGQKATGWWATAMAALIAAWFGVTTVYHIPSLVRATAAGQAKDAAEASARAAKKDAEAIKALRDQFQGDSIIVTIMNEGDQTALLRFDSTTQERLLYRQDANSLNAEDKSQRWIVKLAPPLQAE